MEIDKLSLLAGVDIPAPTLRVNIHQPTIREIAILGEEKFYKYLGYFQIDKVKVARSLVATMRDMEEADLEAAVNSVLENMSDFELFMQVVNNPKDPDARIGTETILMFLMPKFSFSIEERMIIGLAFADGKTQTVSIDEEGFKQLREIIKTIFCLDVVRAEEFNPIDERAKAIADKIKRGREKVKALKGQKDEKTFVLANYLSGLGIGSNALNLLEAVNLTVYQLFNQMERFGLKTQYDHGISAMLAGAKDVELVDWLKSL